MKTIKIFLASSNELISDREKVEIYLYRKNKKLVPNGIFLHLDIWEDMDTSVSLTRKQDHYNKNITDADIFVMLYERKVGKYTKEEFEIAYNQMRERNNIRVYTYFKESNISTTEIAKKEFEIQSLIEFKKYLDTIEHFPSIYNSSSDLTFKLNNEIDNFLSNMSVDNIYEVDNISSADFDLKSLEDIHEVEYIVNQNNLMLNSLSRHHYKIVSLQDLVEYMPFGSNTGTSKAIKYENYNPIIIPESIIREKGTVIFEKRFNDDYKNIGRIRFVPELSKDEIVEFTVETYTESRRFICYEDFENAKWEGKYVKDKIDETLQFTIKRPTVKFSRKLSFPKNYPLDGSFKVTVKKPYGNKIDDKENNRVNKSFKISNQIDDNLSMEFSIKNPIIKNKYAFRWIPQTLNNLESSGILTKQQVEIIINRTRRK